MGAYYYASGKRIELDHDPELVAIDGNAAARAGVDRSDIRAAHTAGGIIVASRSAVSESALERLKNAGALQPVFKRQRTIVIPLPEVRIEFDNAEQRAAVMKVLNEAGARHEIAEESDERIVVKPASGDGAAAMTLANRVYEQAKPAASSVRFVQFVPKPDLVR